MYEKFGQFIDGKWQQSSDKGTYEVINPANEEILVHASKATPKDEAALQSAAKGLEVWKKLLHGKDRISSKIADRLEKTRYFSQVDDIRSWKPIAEAKGEINGAADIFEWTKKQKEFMDKPLKADLKTLECMFITNLLE